MEKVRIFKFLKEWTNSNLRFVTNFPVFKIFKAVKECKECNQYNSVINEWIWLAKNFVKN